MVTLDRVIELQSQGVPDADIIRQLQNEGVPPQEINDSINQAKIKNAVSPPAIQPPVPEIPSPAIPNENSTELQAPQEMLQENLPPQGVAQAPEMYPPQDFQPQQEAQDQYYQQTPQAYSNQEYYMPGNQADTETITEVAEQVATEKIQEFENKTGDLLSFKTTTEDKLSNLDERLKRIEETIDKLQHAIIGKVGEFGQSSALIHKDLENLHGSVSNLMNPLIDNLNELKKSKE